MFMILIVGLGALAEPVPAEAKEAPRFLTASADGDKLICQVTTTITAQVPVVTVVNGMAVLNYETVRQQVQTRESYDLKGATVTTVGGERLDVETVKKRLATKAKVVVSSNTRPVDPSYLKGLDKDVIVIVALAEPKKLPGPPTPVELEKQKK